jgi:hypothetical protein
LGSKGGFVVVDTVTMGRFSIIQMLTC